MNLLGLYHFLYNYGYETVINVVHNDKVLAIITNGKKMLSVDLTKVSFMEIVNYFEGGDKNVQRTLGIRRSYF